MTKSELNARFAALLESEDISSVKQEIRTIQEAYRQLRNAEMSVSDVAEVMEASVESTDQDAQKPSNDLEVNESVTSDESEMEEFSTELEEAEGSAEELEESELVVPREKTENDIFNDLSRAFKKRMQEHQAKLEKQRELNLKEKQILVAQMTALVAGEGSNYKELFEEFNKLRDAWRTIGHVPMENARDINERFYHEQNNFFYKFRIHQELRELDLKKNKESREMIIVRAEGLDSIEGLKELEAFMDALKRDWSEAGQVSHEDFRNLYDRFFAIIRKHEDRIHSHYRGLRQEQENNIALKKDLIAKIKAIVDSEEEESWKSKTEKVIALQEEWKTVGFVRREQNDQLWTEFREVSNGFFDKRNEFFKENDAAAEAGREAKKQLIEKAIALRDSSEWGKTTKELKELQEAWKNSGKLRYKDEEKLWKSFRKACNHFFDRKQAHFGDIKGEQENNLFLKNQLIEEVENFAFTGERHTDLIKLKEFNERWNAIGFVPKNDIDGVIKKFRSALDKHFKHLDAEADERQLTRFKEKIESVGSERSESQARKEQHFLREKIDILKKEIMQYKSNIIIFTGKGAADLHKEIEKKIGIAEKEIEQTKKKLEVLKGMLQQEQE